MKINIFLVLSFFNIYAENLFAQACVDLNGTYTVSESKTCNLDRLRKAVNPLPIRFSENNDKSAKQILLDVPFKIIQTECSSLTIEVNYVDENGGFKIANIPIFGESSEDSAGLKIKFSSNNIQWNKSESQNGCFSTTYQGTWCGISKVKSESTLTQDVIDNVIYRIKSSYHGVGISKFIPMVDLENSEFNCVFKRID